MIFNKTRKSVLGFISMALMVCLMSSSAMAAAPSSALTLEQVSEKYALKDIEASSIPENIQPIVFNDVNELDAFLAEIQNQTVELKQRPAEDIKDAETESTIQPMTIQTDYQQKRVANWSYGGMDMFVRYQYNDSVSPYRFTTCNTIITTFSGVYTGCQWQQLDSWYSLLDNNRTLSATAYGHLTYYLIVGGEKKIYETNATVNGEFYL